MSGPAMVEVKCKSCKTAFMARVADRKRGWGKFCSKSCKAIKQTQRTGIGRGGEIAHPGRRCVINGRQYAANGDFEGFVMSHADLRGGGYGDSDPYDGLPVGADKW